MGSACQTTSFAKPNVTLHFYQMNNNQSIMTSMPSIIMEQKHAIKEMVKRTKSLDNLVHITTPTKEDELNQSYEPDISFLSPIKKPKKEEFGDSNPLPKKVLAKMMISRTRERRSYSVVGTTPYKRKSESLGDTLNTSTTVIETNQTNDEFRQPMRTRNRSFSVGGGSPKRFVIKHFFKEVEKLGVPLKHVEKKENDCDGFKIINQYKVIEKLGRGSYGVVKKCYDMEFPGNFYAMKIFNLNKIYRENRNLFKRGLGKKVRSGQNPFELIKNEIVVLNQLDHENIMHLYEVLIDTRTEKLYLVLEFFGGGILFQIDEEEVKSKPYNEKQAHFYFSQISKAVKYCHDRNIAHRDIKFENVMLTRNGDKCVLCDFGSSQVFEGKDFCHDTRGTHEFFPPEMCSPGEVLHGKAQDVWCLGITLYSLVFGNLPFLGEINKDLPECARIFQIYQDILKNDLIFPPVVSTSNSFKDLVRKILEKDPEKRLDILGILNHEWMKRMDEDVNISTPKKLKKKVTGDLKKYLEVTNRIKKVRKWKITSIHRNKRKYSPFSHSPITKLRSRNKDMFENLESASKKLFQ